VWSSSPLPPLRRPEGSVFQVLCGMMVGVCRKKMCSMGRDVAAPIYLRSFIGLTCQAARRALQSLSLIPMRRPVADGGIGSFLIFQGRSRNYLQARATRIQGGYRLLAFNAEMNIPAAAFGIPSPYRRRHRRMRRPDDQNAGSRDCAAWLQLLLTAEYKTRPGFFSHQDDPRCTSFYPHLGNWFV